MSQNLQTIQAKISQKAMDQAKVDVEALIKTFTSNSAYRRADTNFIMDVHMKLPQDRYEQAYQAKIRSYEYWEMLSRVMIIARTEELIEEYSQQVLDAVDSIEYLKQEMSTMKEER